MLNCWTSKYMALGLVPGDGGFITGFSSRAHLTSSSAAGGQDDLCNMPCNNWVIRHWRYHHWSLKELRRKRVQIMWRFLVCASTRGDLLVALYPLFSASHRQLSLCSKDTGLGQRLPLQLLWKLKGRNWAPYNGGQKGLWVQSSSLSFWYEWVGTLAQPLFFYPMDITPHCCQQISVSTKPSPLFLPITQVTWNDAHS